MFKRLGGWLRQGAGLLVALLFVLPLFWALVASLRPLGLPPPVTIEWWPAAPQWDNYAAIFQLVPMGRYLLNSLIVVGVAVPLTLLTASMAGFAMALLPEGARQRLLLASIALLIVPASAVWLFRFQILRWTGLLDTLGALMVPALAGTNPLFVLLFYWAFRHIPLEIFEAARLDGASVLTMWRRVAMPLVIPTSMTVIVLTFVTYWSDFISPLIYLYQPKNYTLPIGLRILTQVDSTNWPLLMAAAVFMTLPVVVLFGFLQRFFLHDLSPANLFGKN